ncbi:aminopeptidase N [Catenovulum sp. 2E275]|uniref:aminopeptidase N n=1 Tax=Catenovulum sp. 2E275 TaxID=2980497 RepID=UPI0021CF92B8|nr:aminopeptidase N [Catenovulum sp. 2E275]MCU4674684.1 aminopeptidase N [Catenovulum sp. 2E275]
MTNAPNARYLKDYTVPPYLVNDTELTFELNSGFTQVTATVKYIKNGQHDLPLTLNGEHQKLISVKINQQVLSANDYELSEEQIVIKTDLTEFELEIISQIDPANNTSLEGLYLSDGAYCTQCEAEGFRRITYFQDRPDVLSTFTTHIIADPTQYPYLLSNGNKVAEQTLDSGLTKVTWQDPYKKPCYLFALVAGNFDVLSDKFITKSGREVVLELFVDKGNLARADHAMASLKQAMAWDESRFSLEYDLDIYMIVAVDFFNMGAMENKGLNVFNSKCVLADSASATDSDYLSIESIVGHEYFHNWTGNRVTCRDWFQLSLKEGLTVFRDQEFSMDLGSRAVNRIQQVKIMREHQFAEDAGPMSHPIRPESVIEMNNFYTVTVYDKGAEVIRMMHSILGEEKFQAGMKLYFERHDGQAVTCDDFVSAMQDASNIDLTQFKLWYSQSGTPVVGISSDYDPTAQLFTIHITQNTPATADQQAKSALHIPINIAFYNDKGEPLAVTLDNEESNEQVLNLTQAEQSFSFKVNQQPIVSYLRDFSAPVKLDYQYDDNELRTLILAESSEYTKWELMQTLYIQHLKLNIEHSDYQYPAAIFGLLKELLADPALDKALLADLLKVPSFASILEHYQQADVDKILAAREALSLAISTELAEELTQVYQANYCAEYQYNQQAIAQRALANTCLCILAESNQADIDAKIKLQYQNASNMTDTLAAMSAAAKLACAGVFNAIMQDFDNHWRGDALVMDKWFATFAKLDSDSVLDKLDELQQHSDFNWHNPNRVRALIGQFAMFNHAQFHHASGRGYQYLAKVIKKLNSINPQVAARMITPLIQYKKLDSARQQLIIEQLQQLAELPGLSKDLFEKITKALPK